MSEIEGFLEMAKVGLTLEQHQLLKGLNELLGMAEPGDVHDAVRNYFLKLLFNYF